MLWSPLKEIFSPKEKGFPFFYIGIALSFLFLSIIPLCQSRNKFTVPYEKSLGFFLFSLSFSNLADELFFNPTTFQWNEIVCLLVGLFGSTKIYRHVRYKK